MSKWAILFLVILIMLIAMYLTFIFYYFIKIYPQVLKSKLDNFINKIWTFINKAKNSYDKICQLSLNNDECKELEKQIGINLHEVCSLYKACKILKTKVDDIVYLHMNKHAFWHLKCTILIKKKYKEIYFKRLEIFNLLETIFKKVAEIDKKSGNIQKIVNKYKVSLNDLSNIMAGEHEHFPQHFIDNLKDKKTIIQKKLVDFNNDEYLKWNEKILKQNLLEIKNLIIEYATFYFKFKNNYKNLNYIVEKYKKNQQLIKELNNIKLEQLIKEMLEKEFKFNYEIEVEKIKTLINKCQNSKDISNIEQIINKLLASINTTSIKIYNYIKTFAFHLKIQNNIKKIIEKIDIQNKKISDFFASETKKNLLKSEYFNVYKPILNSFIDIKNNNWMDIVEFIELKRWLESLLNLLKIQNKIINKIDEQEYQNNQIEFYIENFKRLTANIKVLNISLNPIDIENINSLFTFICKFKNNNFSANELNDFLSYLSNEINFLNCKIQYFLIIKNVEFSLRKDVSENSNAQNLFNELQKLKGYNDDKKAIDLIYDYIEEQYN